MTGIPFEGDAARAAVAPGAAAIAGISVVLPAYNEEQNLAGTVNDVVRVLRRIGSPFEVIVVDDGSRDSTAKVAQELRHALPELRVVSHERNRGYGAALRSGFAAASEPWVFFTDSDGQFDLDELQLLLPLTSDADIVAGFRRQRQDPWHRRLYALLFGRLLVPATLGVRVRDLNCAFKLMRRDLVSRLDLRSEGALINAELLGKAAHAGARVREIGVSHRPRRAGAPTGGNPAVILRAFRELLALQAEIRGWPSR